MEETLDINAIIKRVIGILTNPVNEWKTIKGENSTVADLFVKYGLILAAIPFVFGILSWVIHSRYFFGTFLGLFLCQYILFLAAAYVTAMVIDLLAPSFDSGKNIVQALKITIYSYTALWITGVLFLIPRIGRYAFWAGFVYASFLIFLGMQELKDTPKDKKMTYAAVVVVANLIVFILADFLAMRIALGTYIMF